MTVKRIDQLLAGFAEGDAISTEAIQLRDVFRGMGFDSDLFAEPERVAPGVTTDWKPLAECGGASADIVLHHYSIASPAADYFKSSAAKKILVYHNITPAESFRGFDDAVARSLDEARRGLKATALQADAVWADSEFNAGELEEAGVPDVKVFPLLFDPSALDLAPERRVLDTFAAPMTNILFVGRIAPNKSIEDLILAYAWYYETINPFSRLVIVGSERSAPRYFAMLRMLAGELELANVCFERFASPSGLVAYYEKADVFVTASRHEGFCLPLVEAMYKNVPVIARATGGMPEALGEAGVTFDDMEPGELAELIHRVSAEGVLRSDILSSQAARVETLRARNVENEVQELLEHML